MLKRDRTKRSGRRGGSTPPIIGATTTAGPATARQGNDSPAGTRRLLAMLCERERRGVPGVHPRSEMMRHLVWGHGSQRRW
jgi:hypothetical protein